jgi:NADH:ubiquinone oxidoreductase subunit
MVPPGWHGWLNRAREKAPSEQPLTAKRWEKEHLPNLSGSPQAYVPPGHERRGGQRERATGDYEAWRP